MNGFLLYLGACVAGWVFAWAEDRSLDWYSSRRASRRSNRRIERLRAERAAEVAALGLRPAGRQAP